MEGEDLNLRDNCKTEFYYLITNWACANGKWKMRILA